MVDFSKRYIPSKRDYMQDFSCENGMYFHACKECGALYVAHKYRRGSICNVCKNKFEPIENKGGIKNGCRKINRINTKRDQANRR